MPGSAIAELILQPLFEIVVQLAGYCTARLIVPVFTLGNVTVEPLHSGKKVYPKWRRPMTIGATPKVLDAEMASLIGLVFWLLIATTAYLIWSKT